MGAFLAQDLLLGLLLIGLGVPLARRRVPPTRLSASCRNLYKGNCGASLDRNC